MLRKIIYLSLTLWILAACSPQGPEGSEVLGPLQVSFNPQNPDEVVSDFLDEWSQKDYTSMYELLSLKSKALYSFAQFSDRYQLAEDQLKFDGVTYALKNETRQGDTIAIDYSVNISSPVFGMINDPNRTIRLVKENDQWRIAWSTMDILDGMAGDVSIKVDSRFPVRANIYDRNGDLLVEENGQIMYLFGIKQDMRNVDDCLSLLARVMRRSSTQLSQIFLQNNDDTLFYIGEIDPERFFEASQDLNEICAIYDGSGKIFTYNNRRYFGHGAATHVTGYIGRIPTEEIEIWKSRGYLPSDLVGRAGIEARFEQVLAGKPEQVLRMVEPGGATIRELGGASGSEPTPVQLTIDRGLQMATASALVDAYNYASINWANRATGSAAIVVDVNTGAILSLVSYPTFDPSLFNPDTSYPIEILESTLSDTRSPLSNKAIAEQYAPGSVFKVVTSVAAANEHLFRPDELFDCPLTWSGVEEFGDTITTRYDWRYSDELDAAGEVTMAEALATSCNPFFWTVGGMLYEEDPGKLTDYSKQFGLGVPTGLSDLGNEVGGNLAEPTNVTEAINNAIGQGNFQVTPIQMAMVTAAIANDGTLYQPYIVKQVGGLDDTPLQQETAPKVIRELVLDEGVLDLVREGMCGVTTNSDLGTAVRVFGDSPYTVCGKTGTAEAGFAPHAWFIAYAPAENPQIAVVVFTGNSREGSEVAAPVVRRILDYYFGTDIKPYPDWWNSEYIPVKKPSDVQAGGGG
ncbi:hypothetical protein MASR2M15_26010 [Anaerolineales bacterium]